MILPLLAILAIGVNAVSYKGVDWSSAIVAENAGAVYKNSAGTAQSLESILKANGVNTVRQRLWTSSANYGLSYNLNLAKRAKAAGLNVYLDLHFSDTWADPGSQSTPSAWSSLGIDDLADKVYHYTMDTMNSFAAAGISISLVSIGNEISNGFLFPLGKLGSTTGNYNCARLLHSASSGIRDSKISGAKILIHVANGWNFATQKYFYDTVLGAGPLTSADYDVQAVSYYPMYGSGATLASLKSSLNQMSSKYGKDVMVVETNWPVSCPNPNSAFPSDLSSIPFSAAGQATFLKDVAGVAGSGLMYWEPAWLKNAGLGTSCDDNLMFDQTGTARSSLSVFSGL
ncbi:arabinogalactan endo-1,4-beta-galactosidase A like protein [Zymoseptoria brevis]|uniref:Arabinogalactan endo-beta-1,4-galactanase n=1 Tax=Zymoseptoria brevis TaxID=1047168 RepID=A0A0F4GM73_9PEZI|nr:arabinogalactan endo-1,4-beta-galactosidase A like protein [Zymoseptoria brevis]